MTLACVSLNTPPSVFLRTRTKGFVWQNPTTYGSRPVCIWQFPKVRIHVLTSRSTLISRVWLKAQNSYGYLPMHDGLMVEHTNNRPYDKVTRYRPFRPSRAYLFSSHMFLSTNRGDIFHFSFCHRLFPPHTTKEPLFRRRQNINHVHGGITVRYGGVDTRKDTGDMWRFSAGRRRPSDEHDRSFVPCGRHLPGLHTCRDRYLKF